MSHQQTQGFLDQAQTGIEQFQQGLDPLQQQLGGFQDVTNQALGAFGSFNPLEAQQQLFQQQQAMMQPYQDQQRQSQEARLLAQGRLGSTGGGIQQQALEGAFQQQQQGALYNAFQQSQGAQQNLLGLAQGAFAPQMNFSGLQAQVPGMFQQQAAMQPQKGHGFFSTGLGAFVGSLGAGVAGGMGSALGGSLFGGMGGGAVDPSTAGRNYMNTGYV